MLIINLLLPYSVAKLDTLIGKPILILINQLQYRNIALKALLALKITIEIIIPPPAKQ